MPFTEAQLNRRDAMSAEADQSQSPEDVSLEGGWFGHSLPLLFLRAHRASAFAFYVARLNLHRLAPHPGDLGAAGTAFAVDQVQRGNGEDVTFDNGLFAVGTPG